MPSISLAEYRKMQKPPEKKGTKKKKKPVDVTGSITMSESVIEFAWQGIDISLNEWYSGKHWTAKNKEVQYWHTFFQSFLQKPYPRFEAYDITIEYNSRLDPSNCITMIKLYEDMLQKEKIIPNDNKQCCRWIKLMPVLEMGKKDYKIIVNAR